MAIIEKMKRYQREHNLNQRELAKRIDVGEVSLNRWLNRRVAPGKLWQKEICKKLGI